MKASVQLSLPCCQITIAIYVSPIFQIITLQNVKSYDPSNIVQQRVTQFPDKDKSMLTIKEYNYLSKRKRKISNLYMLPKLHKSKRINKIRKKEQCEYINVEKNIIVEANLIVIGPVYHTSGLLETLHIITKPSLTMISNIAKDSFYFKNRLDNYCPNGNALSTCNIKPLYSNIRHDLSYRAAEYWIEKLRNDLPLLRRFNKQFILEGLSIVVAYKGIKIFALLL